MSDINADALRGEFATESNRLITIFKRDRPEYLSAIYSATSVSIVSGAIAIGAVTGRGVILFDFGVTPIVAVIVALASPFVGDAIGLGIAYSVLILIFASVGIILSKIHRHFTFKIALRRSCDKLVELKKKMRKQDSVHFNEELDSIDALLKLILPLTGKKYEKSHRT